MVAGTRRLTARGKEEEDEEEVPTGGGGGKVGTFKIALKPL